MSFTQLFPKYNSSLNPLCGSAIQCSIKKLQQNVVLVDIGLKTLIICFQHELKRMPITKQAKFILGIEDVEVFGFLLNSIKGGYAIAIVGHIAFLPKSLRRSRKVFHSQWRIFSILNMNPKIGNIVVKDIDDGKIDFFSPAKAH
ncbi:unnamed protein product [Sphagnum balticum]